MGANRSGGKPPGRAPVSRGRPARRDGRGARPDSPRRSSPRPRGARRGASAEPAERRGRLRARAADEPEPGPGHDGEVEGRDQLPARDRRRGQERAADGDVARRDGGVDRGRRVGAGHRGRLGRGQPAQTEPGVPGRGGLLLVEHERHADQAVRGEVLGTGDEAGHVRAQERREERAQQRFPMQGPVWGPSPADGHVHVAGRHVADLSTEVPGQVRSQDRRAPPGAGGASARAGKAQAWTAFAGPETCSTSGAAEACAPRQALSTVRKAGPSARARSRPRSVRETER